MARLFSAAVHATCLGLLVWGALAVMPLVQSSPFMQHAEWYQFLTIQGSWVASLTTCFFVLSDIYTSSDVLIRTRRLLLMIAMPLAATISVIYWTLIFLAPGLLASVPPGGTTTEPMSTSSGAASGLQSMVFIPLPMDLALHLLPVVVLTSHFFLAEEKYTANDAAAIAPLMASIYGIFYAALSEWCVKNGGNYPYPFLEVEAKYRIAIYSGSVSLALYAFRALNDLHPGQPLLSPATKRKTV